jgi:glycosyltransferase involved in cell wall biosynthesis
VAAVSQATLPGAPTPPALGPRALRRVLVVNTADSGGGAERMAMSVLEGFNRLGTDTWLAVGHKRTAHPRVVPVHAAARRRPAARINRRLVEARRRLDRAIGFEDLVHWSTRDLLGLTETGEADLLFCHNLHGGYFDLRELGSLSHRLPVVLRLADSWSFTGHCAVPPACDRWEHGCGRCPDLATPPAIRRDLTAYNWRRKRRMLSRARLHVIAPSQWLMDRAHRSLLGPAIASSAVVGNGVDTETFTPGPAEPERRALGIDPDADVLVYASNLGAANPHKDFPTLHRAMRRWAAAGRRRPLELLVVGAEAPDERLAPSVRIRHLPYEADSRRLARLYRAADVYVHAAHDEAFCLTAAEAMSCGRPVVAAASGGIAEVVDGGRTGLLVGPGDDAALAVALRELLGDAEHGRSMGARAAADVRRRFEGGQVVAELHQWCAALVAGVPPR